MNKLLPEEQTTIETYNKVAQIWSSSHHQSDFWAKEMKRFQKLLPAGKILDIGCGGSRDAYGLLALGFEYVGTDMSEALLSIAKKDHPGQSFYKQSVYELSFPDSEKFDGFWCSAVLLHVPKRRINLALARIRSVVKPGAIGFISLKDGAGEKLETETWTNGGTYKRFFSYWSKDGFSKALNQNNLEVLDYLYRPDSEKTRWHCFFVRATD